MVDNQAFRIQEEGISYVVEEKEDKNVENGLNEIPPLKTTSNSSLNYSLDDIPPWYLCIFLGLQHYLTMFGATVSIPYLLAPALCIGPDDPARALMLSTIIFISGVITLLQTTLGVRLPIVQGGTFSFIVPTLALLSLPAWKCPSSITEDNNNETNWISNSTSKISSDEIWQRRMREVQGAIICASLFQFILGVTGLVGLLLRFITPMSITPVITLVGLSLFQNATDLASGNWIVAMITVVLVVGFSQYMRLINIPCFVFDRKQGCRSKGFPIFNLFPILLSIITIWVICVILTIYDVFPEGDPGRTDRNDKIISAAPWFRVPYPGQWGWPTVSAAGVLGMLGGCLASTVESIGDYYACARLSNAPRPPVHAINRGITIEGLGCILAGLWGSGNGTTSYGENIAVIGVTKVASRRVVQTAGILMLIAGSITKLGAIFVTIPDPIIGGIFFVMMGFITAVGISNLQFVDLNSSRNLFVIGFPLFFGLALPKWLASHPEVINTGHVEADNVIKVLLTTSMFVGGILGIILDNTVPGSDEERGLLKWTSQGEHHEDIPTDIFDSYDLPIGMNALKRWKWTQYIPISPTYDPHVNSCGKRRSNKIELNNIRAK